MANYTYIIPSGVIVPDTEEVLTQVQSEYKAAFGADLIVTPNTPQGILITAETLSRIAVLNNNAALANQFNPNLSGGVFLDAIMALTGSARLPAVYSSVEAELTGVPGTTIPAGSQAKENVHGEIFESVNIISLDDSGNGSGEFRAVNAGPITCGSGNLTQIVTGVIGWETITNAAAATVGAFTQSDAAARNLRRVTLASQGSSSGEAITSGLYNTTGVKSLSYRENISGSTVVIDGVSMVGHSIYVCVDGGSDDDIAETLENKKSAGAAYNGSTTVNYTVPYSGQVIAVKFDRPDEIYILVRVTVAANSAIADIQAAVIQSILDYAAGTLSGQPGLTVGTAVSPFELAGAVKEEYPSIFVKKVEVSATMPISYSCDDFPIAIFEKAVIIESNIQVIVA